MQKQIILIPLLGLTTVISLSIYGQGTAFTYQGKLSAYGTNATGNYDFSFSLYGIASGGGSPLMGPITNSTTAVSNGLFVVTLDFGPGAFTGAARWLEIGTRVSGAPVGFTMLNPRQSLLPTPYAITANASSNLLAAVGSNQISGTYGNPVHFNNSANTFDGTFYGEGGFYGPSFNGGTISGSFFGNGAGLTNLNLPAAGSIALLNATNAFTGTNSFAGVTIATNVNNLLKGTLTGNVVGSATAATNFTGNLGGDVSGPQNATVITAVGGLAAASIASGAAAANAATNASNANAIVRRDASGNFSAGTITASLAGNATTATSFLGPLSGDVTGIQGATVVTNISTATSSNLPNRIVKRDANGSFSVNTITLNGTLLLPAAPATVYSGTNILLRVDAGGSFFSGLGAGASATGGNFNTAVGSQSLSNNINGIENTAAGYQSLQSNTSGNDNTAQGAYALQFNTAGGGNTAEGTYALFSNTSGNNNTALGAGALQGNTSGGNNIAIGVNAGGNLSTGSQNIDIGHPGTVGESNTIRIGTSGIQSNAFFAGIWDNVSGTGLQVKVDSSGHLSVGGGSSERFKEDIRGMNDSSETLLALRPVIFRYKEGIDPGGLTQFGLIAEEVNSVDPSLVVRDNQGEIYGVRYDAINAMLLNEFLKQHRKVEEQSHEIQRLRTELSTVQREFQSELLRLEKALGATEQNQSLTPTR